jgi:hypothetical protein
VIALLVACSGSGRDGDVAVADSSDDSGSSSTEGCDESVTPELERAPVGTAAILTFTLDEATRARAVFDDGDGRERSTDSSESTADQRLVLVGVLPEVSFSWRVEVERDGEAVCVASGTAENGPLPSGLPEWSFEGTDSDALAPGLNILPIITSSAPNVTWIALVDEEGRSVWAWSPAADAMAAKVTGAELLRDRSGILFGVEASTEDGPSWFGKVGFDGEWSKVVDSNG